MTIERKPRTGIAVAGILLAAAIVSVALPVRSCAQEKPLPALADPVTIKVTRQQLLVIGQGLQELPAKVANPILNDLQEQLNRADAEAKAAAAPDGTKKNP